MNMSLFLSALSKKAVYIWFIVHVFKRKMKLIWPCFLFLFFVETAGGFFLLGLQVFYTEEWLRSVRLHSSSSSSPRGGSAPLLWNLGCSSMAFLRRRVWLWTFFFFFFLRRKVKPVDGGWIPNIQKLQAWEGMVEFETKVGDGTREEMETERGEVWVKRLHSSFVVSEGESSGSTWWDAGLCPPSLPTDTMGLCVADLRNAERCQGWRMEAYRASRGQRQGEKVRVMDTEEHDNATARRFLNFFVPALGLSMRVLPILCGFLCHFKKSSVLNSYRGDVR